MKAVQIGIQNLLPVCVLNILRSCSNISKDDLTDLQGAAVTLAELGEYTRAASLLEDLKKVWSDTLTTCLLVAAQQVPFQISLIFTLFMFYMTQENPNDPDVFRLLGEAKYKLKDYGGSADAYKTASMVGMLSIYVILLLLFMFII